MINGIQIKLVYHLYLKDIESIENSSYYEINRRCLAHFHDIFDSSLFCICVNDTGDAELIKKGIDWILSCGFSKNVVIKIKPNSAFCDAQTFYDEVVDKLSSFKELVFFAHNKGCGEKNEKSGLKQWIIFSYFASLNDIEYKASNLIELAVAHTYAPLYHEVFGSNKWIAPGTIFLFNPMKVYNYLKEYGKDVPKLQDRFSAEKFLSTIFKIDKPAYLGYDICFEKWRNGYWEGDVNYYNIDHKQLITQFLPEEQVAEYLDFYNEITA